MRRNTSRVGKKLVIGVGCALTLVSGNWVQANPVIESAVVVGSNEEKETIALDKYYGLYPLYNSVNITSGGKWRPVDGGYVYLLGDLTMQKDSVLDLGWATGGYGGITPTNLTVGGGTVTLHDNTILRMNYLGDFGATDWLNFINTTTDQNTNDTFFAFPDGNADMYFQLGYVTKDNDNNDIDWSKSPTDISVDLTRNGLRVPIVMFYDYDFYTPLAIPEELSITAQGSYMDTPLTKYWIEPEIEFRPNDSTYPGWFLTGYNLKNSGLASEAVMSAADNQRAINNLWRFEDSVVFNRTNELHLVGRKNDDTHGSLSKQELDEGVWTNLYRGKYQYDSSYGRQINQNYQGVQVGLDIEHARPFYNGKLYRGVFFGLSEADAVFPSGKSDLKSRGIGLYHSWLGNKGHFLDASLRFARLENEYKYVDSAGSSGTNEYKTWAWGLSTQYGYRKDMAGGFYYQPQVGLSYGRMNATDYTLANGLQFHQDGQNFLTGRLGIQAGKAISPADDIYFKAMLNHDFFGASDAFTAFGNSSLKVEPLADKDTWVDLTIGAHKEIGRNKNAYLEFTKTVGGDVRSDWQVAGGFSWSWGAAGAAKEISNDSPPVSKDVVSKTENIPEERTIEDAPLARQATQADKTLPIQQEPQNNEIGSVGIAVDSEVEANYVPDSVPAAQKELSTYELAGITVEASRPAWEKTLSPGTVSVVYPEEYKGEMKKLPEMLQTVAGVFVQRVQGTGHYSVARVRGSTGAQVNVYVDGILMNSAGQTGVDLSAIPVENVARIEVYKGYIPARFSGASIGGAINIVTKRPGKASGSVAYGMRSFDGYTGNMEITTPLGSGSLMAAVNRDQSRGEFGYEKISGGWTGSTIPGEITEPYPVWRQNNQYNHTDAMLKWQDENWLAKVSYVRKHDGAPIGASNRIGDLWSFNSSYPHNGWTRGSAVRVKDENVDVLLGRRQEVGNLEWGWQFNYGHHEKTSRFYRQTSQFTPAGINSWYKHDIYGLKLDGNWKMGEAHLVEFLFNTTRETMKTDGNYYGRPEYSSVIGGRREFLHKYDIKNHYFQIQDSITLDRDGTLIFTPLWRAQKMDMTSFKTEGEEDWKYSYGLGLKKQLNKGTTLRATYGTYWRAPNFYEMFGDGGVYVRPRPTTLAGSDITWENGEQYDIGIDWDGKALGAKMDTSLTYFNRHVDNLANHVVTADGSIYYLNAGKGKIDGLELETNWRWRRWELNQSVTWNNSKILQTIGKYGVTYNPQQCFTGIPEWETNSRLTYYCGDNKTSLFTEYHYTSDLTGDITEAGWPAGYNKSIGLLNFGVKYNPNKAWKFTAGVNDIFNKGPEQLQVGYAGTTTAKEYNVPYPQQGRTYYMSMQYLF